MVLQLVLTISLIGLAADVGDKPAFDARTTDKTSLSPTALRNHIAVFYGWRAESTSWREALPKLKKLNQKYRPRGVEIVGINEDKDVKPLLAYLREHRIVWPQVHDSSQKKPLRPALLNDSGEALAFVLLDPQGVVRWTGELKDLDAAIQKALTDHPPKPTAEQWRAIALTSLAGASRAMKDKDYERAVANLAQVNPEVRNDRRVQMTALAMASSFDVKGADAQKLKAALKDYPEAGKFVDMAQKMSSPQLQALAQQFLGNSRPPARPKPSMGSAQRALGRLKIAQRYAKGGKHHEAYRILSELLDKYAGSEAAAQAEPLIAKYKADKKFMAAHQDYAQEKPARSLLALAKNYLAAGKRDLAKQKLQEVVDQFAKTKAADEARRELAKLQ